MWSYPAAERLKIKGFYIEKAVGGQQNFKSIAFLGSDAHQFADKNFEIKQDYFYKIRVYSLNDVLSDDSPVIRATPLMSPSAPKGFSYLLTEDAVKLQWEGNDKKVKYNVYKSYEKGSYPLQPFNASPISEMFFYDRIETDRTVYYTVRALLDTDIRDEGFPSEELGVDPALFVPSKPTGLSYAVSEKNVYLLWDGNPENWVKGYRIYRKKQGETEFKPIGEAVTPAFIDVVNLTTQAVYYVTAIGISKESIPSDFAEVLPVIEK